MEKWILLEGNFDNYAVSDLGNVKNVKTNKLLAKSKSPYGYLRVSLSQNCLKATFVIHRLVALAFIPNPENKPCINHIDGNKENNRVDNLEWCTNQENTIHAQNLKLKHDMHPMKLTDINDNKEYFFQSLSQAANFIGVNKSTLSRALKRPTNIYRNFKIEKL